MKQNEIHQLCMNATKITHTEGNFLQGISYSFTAHRGVDNKFEYFIHETVYNEPKSSKITEIIKSKTIKACAAALATRLKHK